MVKTVKQALNPAFLKQKPNREQIELFKKEFKNMLAHINQNETEEFHKRLITDFLNAVYYKDKHYINTKGRNDLVIHNENNPNSFVGVLIEAKSPKNKTEMVSDNNQLNKEFYAELLHIIGLEEITQEGKKLIVRKKVGTRDDGSIIENTIEQISNKNKWDDVSVGVEDIRPLQFDVALDLAITWINRILFLKLLESQIIKYNNGNKEYAFLAPDKLTNYNDLETLFFSVLALKEENRSERVKLKFANIPYLNSSLFELTEMEDKTISIGGLQDNIPMPLFSKSVLNKGINPLVTLKPLEYLLRFLDAYDFSNEGSEEIMEESKPLISASVLGLIFEKINGYKDGSFFTPSFITMYMCRETIGRTVVQKFNEVKKWNYENTEDLYNKLGTNIEDIKEANSIFNTIRICDPAVGSGHFLVSALNEMIYLKSELGILIDKNGKRLKDYHVVVENDELIITDNEGNYFNYNPKDKVSQRVQETFFHEKQTIIENCLFGVDINPNSVKICQLRLWIELLKNAYYPSPFPSMNGGEGGGGRGGLQTLPNIDINIKCGNSLISRFDLQQDIEKFPNHIRQTIKKLTRQYKDQVIIYKYMNDKGSKKRVSEEIARIRNTFREIFDIEDIDYRKLVFAETEERHFRTTISYADEEESRRERHEQLKAKVKELKEKIQQKMKPYVNAFEWRFEFPEVLDDDGNFVGFDVVIGNPPWGVSIDEMQKKNLSAKFNDIPTKTKDTYLYFIKQSFLILKENAFCSLITPNTWLLINSTEKFRKQMLEKNILQIVDYGDGIFQEATVESSSFLAQNTNQTVKVNAIKYSKGHIETNLFIEKQDWIENDGCRILIEVNDTISILLKKIKKDYKIFDDYCSITWGIKPYQIGFGEPAQTQEMMDNRVYHSSECLNDDWKPLLVGKNINRYYLTKNEQFIKYGKNLMYPSNEEIMLQDKIFLRQTSSDIKATFDTEKYYCQNSVFLIFSKIINLKFLLGLLNSKLIGFYYKTNNPQKGKIFAEIKPSVIKSIPIPETYDEQQQPIITLVSQILSLKQANPAADTSALEREINALVYKLYNLTDEEIKIIERGSSPKD